MITYHKNKHQGLSIIKFLIFAPSEMEDFIYIYIYIYIYVKNILGCKLSSVDVCENTAKKNACNRP